MFTDTCKKVAYFLMCQLTTENSQNWPLQSLDLSSLDFHVWGYVKNMVYECKMDTRDELLQQIFNVPSALMTLQFFIKLHFP